MAFTCFLKFPLEIRQHVYRSYFSNLDLSVSFSVSPLLLCSRKMHEEAQQLFWQNGRFTFRSTKTMVGFLTEIDHDTLINVRHIAVRGFPFPCYPNVPEPWSYTMFSFQDVLPLFPGLQLSTLRVIDPFHGNGIMEDGWGHDATHYCVKTFIKSQGF
ncbi:MAG: hypothetical protein Q9203_006240 [Teloschistes exilis]